MSTSEYYDLCYKAQNNLDAKYHIFVFDIKGSKEMPKEERCDAQVKMEELMLKMYAEIENIEIKEDREILLRECIVSYNDRNKVNKKFGMLFEPFLFADTFGFTVYKDSISREEVLEIYDKFKGELGINFSFNINDLYYETNDYSMGGILFFRGYAIDIASNLHKDYMSKVKIKGKK